MRLHVTIEGANTITYGDESFAVIDCVTAVPDEVGLHLVKFEGIEQYIGQIEFDEDFDDDPEVFRIANDIVPFDSGNENESPDAPEDDEEDEGNSNPLDEEEVPEGDTDKSSEDIETDEEDEASDDAEDEDGYNFDEMDLEELLVVAKEHEIKINNKIKNDVEKVRKVVDDAFE